MAKKAEILSMSRFRPVDPFAGMPEIQIDAVTGADRAAKLTPTPTVDLGALPKVWFLIGNGGAGKTTYARWLIWRMIQNGGEAMLAALDPGARALSAWFENVEQPPARDVGRSATWLGELLDYLAQEKSSGILDFGAAGEGALQKLAESVSGLHVGLEEAGLGVVACHMLAPRVWDLQPLINLEAVGFQPKATLLILNEGRVDPDSDPEEAFAPVVQHSAFRKAVDRGAIPLWLPALRGDIMRKIERAQLHFGSARDGQVPAGAAFSPIGGLERSAVGRWLERLAEAHKPIRSWLP